MQKIALAIVFLGSVMVSGCSGISDRDLAYQLFQQRQTLYKKELRQKSSRQAEERAIKSLLASAGEVRPEIESEVMATNVVAPHDFEEFHFGQ